MRKTPILCPRWGRCKATKNCPLKGMIQNNESYIVYVKGWCAGIKNKTVVTEENVRL